MSVRLFRRLTLALPLLWAGCGSSNPLLMTPDDLARTLASRGVDPQEVILPFALNGEMRAWLETAVPDRGSRVERLEALLLRLGSPEGLYVQYETGYTGTAQEVFETRRANCLSFTQLFVGMARELGMEVYFMAVEDVERYAKEGDLVVISGHVTAGFEAGGERKFLEFNVGPEVDYRRAYPISDLTAIALFYSNRGAELLQEGRNQEALRWLERAVTLDPELAHGWINVGVARRRNGQLEGAEAAYRRALELDPRASSAYQNLAALLRVRGRPEEAMELLQVAARLGSRNPYNYLNLGDLSLAHGRLAEAERLYRRALRLEPREAEIHAAMGEWALAAGRREDAAHWLRKARKLNPEEPRVQRLERKLSQGESAGSARAVATLRPAPEVPR